MVFPFGVSVGDFVAVIELVHDVCQALKESAGSRSRFLRLVEEFEHLEEALLAVSRLTAPEGFEEQLAVIKTAAARCEGVILAFLHKNSRFILAFEAEKSKQWWRSPLRKVEWQLYKRDDVEETYRSLQGHTAMIGLLLNAFHINCTYRAQMSWDHKTTALVQCFDKIDGQQTVMAGLFQTMLGAAATMRTEGEQQVGKIIELLNSILELQKLSSSVPAQVLREQPVYFSDACGHLTTFDLSFIASEDAFLYVLQKRFDPRGAKRIEKKQFALQDGKTKRDIDQGRGWKSWFWPGQSVEMSMIFADVERRETNSCPRCGCFSDSALDADAQCGSCGMQFKRIEPVDQGQLDVGRTRRAGQRQNRRTRLAWRHGHNDENRIENGAKGDVQDEEVNTDEDEDEDEDDVSVYERVRLISKTPIKWSPLACSSFLEIASDGLQVKYDGPEILQVNESHGSAVLADRAFALLPSKDSFQYFEIKVVNAGSKNIICIGLSELSVDLGRLPGLELGSIAYHEDKGYAFDSYLSRYLYVSKFGTGDVVGCGVAEGGALGYYTKNGRHLGFFEIKGMTAGIPYPTVGFREDGAEIKANFGAAPFRYDFRKRLRGEKRRIIDTTAENSPV